MQKSEKLDRILSIAKYIEDKVKFFDKKSERARRADVCDEYLDQLRLFRAFSNRAFHLIFDVRNPKKFGDHKFSFLKLTPEEWRKGEEKRKAEGREKFETLHTYSTWFYGTGLYQDYGQYTCDKCGRKFYHSPSIIRRAAKEVYHCCCGYCTNDIITRDYGCKEPFQ